MAFPSKHLTAYSQYLHYEIWIGRAGGATLPHLSSLQGRIDQSIDHEYKEIGFEVEHQEMR